jgi:hypothetical protein
VITGRDFNGASVSVRLSADIVRGHFGADIRKTISVKTVSWSELSTWHGACFALGVDLINAKPVLKETFMNTQISSKLAALAVALVMNIVIIGGVADLFSSQLQSRTAATSLSVQTAQAARVAA